MYCVGFVKNWLSTKQNALSVWQPNATPQTGACKDTEYPKGEMWSKDFAAVTLEDNKMYRLPDWGVQAYRPATTGAVGGTGADASTIATAISAFVSAMFDGNGRPSYMGGQKKLLNGAYMLPYAMGTGSADAQKETGLETVLKGLSRCRHLPSSKNSMMAQEYEYFSILDGGTSWDWGTSGASGTAGTNMGFAAYAQSHHWQHIPATTSVYANSATEHTRSLHKRESSIADVIAYPIIATDRVAVYSPAYSAEQKFLTSCTADTLMNTIEALNDMITGVTELVDWNGGGMGGMTVDA